MVQEGQNTRNETNMTNGLEKLFQFAIAGEGGGTMPHPRLVYVCHPITTGKASLNENVAEIELVCSMIRETGDIAISPYHILRMPTLGTQVEAYEKALSLMCNCNIVDVSGDWWLSTGCILEVITAERCKMAVRYKIQGDGTC